MKTYYIKVKTDDKQLNNKYNSCRVGDKTGNHKSECRKLAPKEYKTGLGKVIHWELCKRLKSVHNINGVCTIHPRK